MDVDEYLTTIYYDPKHPASFGSANKIYRAVKAEGKDVSLGKIKKFLLKQNVHTLNKPPKRKRRRRRVIVPYNHYQYDADTANMIRYSTDNDGKQHILGVINCFSKKLYTRSLESLRAEHVVPAMRSILDETPEMERLRTDLGSEMTSKEMKKLLKERKVKHIPTYNTEIKANQIERAWLSLKRRVFKWFEYSNTHRWIDVLSDLTKSYNQSHHSSIDQTPDSVKPEDEIKIWKRLYEIEPKAKRERKTKPRPRKAFTYNLNDTVRLSIVRKPFQRGFDHQFTVEYFLISDRFVREGLEQYKVKDTQNDPVIGTFGLEDLQLIEVDADEEHKIERIVDRKKVRGRVKVLIKWLGWPEKFNSWVSESDIKDLTLD